MDNLKDRLGAVPTSPNDVAVEWLVWVPLLVAIIVAVLICVLSVVRSRANARSTDEEVSSRIPVGAALLWAAITYTVGNLAIFAYIMTHPTDPRWGTTMTGVDLPEGPEAADLSGVPVAGDILNSWADRLTDGINSTSDSLEGQVNELIAPAIEFNAYRHAFTVADQFLLHASIGAFVALVIALVLHKLQKRSYKKLVHENRQLISEVAETKRQAAATRKYTGYLAYCMEMRDYADRQGELYERPAYDASINYEGWLADHFLGLPRSERQTTNRLMVED